MNLGKYLVIKMIIGIIASLIVCIYSVLDDIIKAKRRRLNAKQKTNEETDRKI